MDNSSVNRGQIERVYEGMQVYDAHGDHMGKVEMVKMGDPEALTARGNEVGTTSGFTPLSSDYNEPEVPEPIRGDLLRVGFIKIDGAGLFDTDRYVRADVIDRIEGDRVYLRLDESRAAVEGEEGTVDCAPRHSERAGGQLHMPPAGIAPMMPGHGNQ